MRIAGLTLVVCCTWTNIGCDRAVPSPGSAGSPPAASAPASAAGGASAAAAAPRPGHSAGPAIELGTITVDGVSVRAARDQGEIRPGGDAPVDVWIDGGLGGAAAVRFWIGVEDATGSLKALAAVEDGKWHNHVEVPDPLPAGSRLWVAIEDREGGERLVSFELQPQ